ncbi:MAG: hypothetical protein KBT57_01245 [bacterium]|nr:hypothetical protein [Candidatus Limimorpha equi]
MLTQVLALPDEERNLVAHRRSQRIREADSYSWGLVGFVVEKDNCG